MVQKTSHRGVHSGNTLRASNTLYSRRYHSQGCIVSRVHPKLLHQLLTTTAERPETQDNHRRRQDKDIEGPQNVAVNVALSLNKQSRWLLPRALVQQVERDDIAGDLTVSVLERHKLKGPACCVSFHSNRGEVKRIQPRGGRYFSFHYPDAQGRSRRAQRRQRREELRQLFRGNKNGRLIGKTVEVFTQQGYAVTDLECGESEVRYEVYYPCPAHSSISHNPKYIKQDVDAAPGSDNEHVQHGKAKRRHRGKQRKRLAVKELDECDLPQYDAVLLQEFLADYRREEEVADLERSNADSRKGEQCLLSSLLDKAERLQQAVRPGGRQLRTRRKSCRKNSSWSDDNQDKQHIVYTEKPESEAPRKPRQAVKNLQVQNTTEELSLTDAPSTRVVLPVGDVTTMSLKNSFVQNYTEAACKPRKFLLNITDNVRELLKKKGKQFGNSEESIQEALSYIVFIHDGFYDNEHDVYKIFLNCRLRPGLLPITLSAECYTDLYRGTVMSLVSLTVDFIDVLLKDVTLKSSCSVQLGMKRQLTRHIGQTEAYIPSLQHFLQQGPLIATITLPTIEEMLMEEPAFCDVCYDDVSPMTSDSAAATALLKCRHTVCDRCWEQHIHSRFQQGFVRFTCPGYDCQEEVSAPVLLSLVRMDMVEKIVQRQEEVRLGASLTDKWCPNQSCGRILRLHTSSSEEVTQAELQRDVICSCGAHVCFGCLEPAHWPATCSQAADYRHRIATAVFPDREAEVHVDQTEKKVDESVQKLEAKKTMIMEGKHCPRCRSFVYKDGGCAQMSCRCGQLFCWYCQNPGFAHHDRMGCVSETEEKRMTTTVIVRHLDSDTKDATTAGKQQDTAVKKGYRRTSFLEKAVDHRRRRLSRNTPRHVISKISKAVATAASKNERVAQHVLKICSSPSSDSSSSATLSSSSTNGPLKSDDYASIASKVATFLEQVISGKSELHELTEYTLVLVKDLPDSLLKRRTLRISDDLGAFCSFVQSVLDAWTNVSSVAEKQQEAVKALTRLAEIQQWIASALAAHVVTVRKIRNHLDQ